MCCFIFVFSEFVPRLGLGSSDPRLLAAPEFVTEPKEYYYLVRNTPIEITCEAISTVQIKFRCAGVDQYHEISEEYFSKKLNKKVLVSHLEVTRDEVKDYFGEDGYWCECTAYNKILGTDNKKSVKSRQGIVQMACKFSIFIFYNDTKNFRFLQSVKMCNPLFIESISIVSDHSCVSFFIFHTSDDFIILRGHTLVLKIMSHICLRGETYCSFEIMININCKFQHIVCFKSPKKTYQ